eukprot:4665195-Pyramimonas_sp.AAC.1
MGLLWLSLEPLSAEFSAFTWASVLATSPADCHVYSDCLNVVRLAGRPKPEQVPGKKMYAGAFLQCH